MTGVRKHMLLRTDQDGLLFVAELGNNGAFAKMDHLVCFLPGQISSRISREPFYITLQEDTVGVIGTIGH